VFSCIWGLEGQVNNGGFLQYYANTDGEAAYEAVTALQQIGARRAAEIVRQANSVFQDGLPPTDRVERQKQLAEVAHLVKNFDDFWDFRRVNLTQVVL
jgi:hypothetical protein